MQQAVDSAQILLRNDTIGSAQKKKKNHWSLTQLYMMLSDWWYKFEQQESVTLIQNIGAEILVFKGRKHGHTDAFLHFSNSSQVNFVHIAQTHPWQLPRGAL